MSRQNKTAAAALTALSFASPVETILRCVWNTPGVARDDGAPSAGLPVIWTSKPGVGKSSRIRGAARSAGFQLETVISSLREPTDFIGLPVPAAGGVMQYVPAAWAVRASDAEHAVVFFDEINGAPQAVQMALLRVVLEGVVGDLNLPNTVRFIAAMNGSQDCPGRWDLDSALANRFLHLPWPDLQTRDWSQWLLGATTEASDPVDPAEEYARITKAWDSKWAQARGMVAAFIERRPDLLLVMPSAGDPSASGAWASPRSWELAARALAGSMLHGLPEQDGDALMAGAVGASIAQEFAAWRAAADLPDPIALLDGKVKFQHDATRPDRTMATLSGCAAVLLNPVCENRTGRGERMFQAMLACLDGGAADMAVLAHQSMLKSKQHCGQLMAAPSFVKVSARMEPFTRAAGMRASGTP